VTTTAAQRFTASASVPASAPAAVPVDFALCYKRAPSNALFFLSGDTTTYQTSTVGPSAQLLVASASSVLATEGTYTVGLCFRNQSIQIVTLQRINGFVQVSN
jgi:hypothetical protein